MKRISSMAVWVGCLTAVSTAGAEKWQTLFNGKNLDEWKVSDHPESVRVEDGMMVVGGARAHAYYMGPIEDGQFKNFEFQAEVMTKPKANSGIYFHTQFEETGWPKQGYEAQVNNTHGDPKKTGGLYTVKDNYKAPVKDNEWFQYHIIVKGKRVILKVNGKTITDYTEPDDLNRPARQLGRGTFALQAHDPGGVVYYRKIRAKVLPD